jgi:hypothetical protein
MKKSLFYFIFALVLLGGMVGARSYLSYHPSPVAQAPRTVTIHYAGKDGTDALTLLKESHGVGTDASGMVTSIDGRKADTSSHEYWAFYVNGELASTGPKDYTSKSTDTLMWKIATY